MSEIAVSLLVYCLIREAFFLYSINKLTNKLMSRNYYDYKVSNVAEIEAKKKQPELKEDLEIPEDLRPLTEVFPVG